MRTSQSLYRRNQTRPKLCQMESEKKERSWRSSDVTGCLSVYAALQLENRECGWNPDGLSVFTYDTHTPGVSIRRQKLVSDLILSVHLEQVGPRSDLVRVQLCCPPADALLLRDQRDISEVDGTSRMSPTYHTHTVTLSSRRSSLPGFPGSGSVGWSSTSGESLHMQPSPRFQSESDMQSLSFSWTNMWVFSIHHTHQVLETRTHIQGSLFHTAASGGASAGPLCFCSLSASSRFLIWLLELAPTLAVCCFLSFGWIFFCFAACIYLTAHPVAAYLHFCSEFTFLILDSTSIDISYQCSFIWAPIGAPWNYLFYIHIFSIIWKWF